MYRRVWDKWEKTKCEQSRERYEMTKLLNTEYEHTTSDPNPHGTGTEKQQALVQNFLASDMYSFKKSHKDKGDRSFVFVGRSPFIFTPTQHVTLFLDTVGPIKGNHHIIRVVVSQTLRPQRHKY
jgi:hypothetical protein